MSNSRFRIEQAPSPNFNRGRGGKKIIAIVLHITAGLYPGCLNWMRNPAAEASTHYLITKNGAIYQMVQDTDTAWHAGIVNKPNWKLYDGTNPNHYTLGIEFECLSGGELTEAQYQAGLWLIKELTQKYGIPITEEHIIGHYRIDAVNRPIDPGPQFPWQRLFNDLKGVEDVPEWMEKIMTDAKAAGLITGEHNPNDNATKWFVLAIALAILKKLGK